MTALLGVEAKLMGYRLVPIGPALPDGLTPRDFIRGIRTPPDIWPTYPRPEERRPGGSGAAHAVQADAFPGVDRRSR